MYKHVLIATDGSELADKAVAQGLELAKRFDAKVTAVTVTEPCPIVVAEGVVLSSTIEDYDRAVALDAARILAAVSERAAKAGVPCAIVHVKDRFPAQGIIDEAAGRGADLIVMSSHGRRGLAKLLLGSQASKVLTLSPVSVLVCR